MFENRVSRKIFRPKRDEVTGEWRKLDNEELNGLYCSPDIVWVLKPRRTRWAKHVVHMGKMRGVYRVLVGKPEGKRSLGRPRRRWEDNIKMDLQEVGWGRVWTGSLKVTYRPKHVVPEHKLSSKCIVIISCVSIFCVIR